jgi:TolB protein
MNLDGSEKTLLLSYPVDRVHTRGNVHLEHPVIRPDRRQIAYYMRQNYQQSIWTMNMDGSWNKRITPWASIASSPNYTPDGRHILFGYLYPSVTDTPAEVYSMNTRGKRWCHIGRYMDSNARLEIQKISNPQGPWIVAESTGDWFMPIARNTKILHADGRNFPLPELAQKGGGFSLNPAHSQFVFCASSSRLNVQIYKMNTDGTGLVQLTSDNASKRLPQFTPDDKQVLFIHGDDRHSKNENADIYIMNADGTNQHALTQTPQNEEWFDVK